MRLLFLSNLYPPFEFGGYEQICREVAEALASRGHEVRVLTSNHGVMDHRREFWRNGVARMLHLQAPFDHYNPAHFFLARSREEAANRRALDRAISECQPDLVAIWGMWNLSRNLPYWAEQRMPGRVAYYISSYWPVDPDIHEAYWSTPALRPVTKQLMRPMSRLAMSTLRREGYPPSLRLENVRCCSRYVRETLVASGRVPSTAEVLYLGIDPGPFVERKDMPANNAGGPLRLLYTGSLLPHKGAHTAIEAMHLLQADGLVDRVSLTVLGGGHADYEAYLHQLVEGYQLRPHVTFPGRVPRDELSSWLHRHDLFLFTSTWAEPMARSVMEAMAAGLLVIGTAVGGQPEMLEDGVTGLTYPAGDARALADRITQVLAAPGCLETIASAGQRAVLERFTLDRMVTEVQDWLAASIR